jgi:hypothetical protein
LARNIRDENNRNREDKTEKKTKIKLFLVMMCIKKSIHFPTQTYQDVRRFASTKFHQVARDEMSPKGKPSKQPKLL